MMRHGLPPSVPDPSASAGRPRSGPSLDTMRTIVRLWQPQYGRLLVGVLIAGLSVCAGLLMMGQAGKRITAAALGVSAGAALLQGTGVAHIVLRYAERYSTHDAMFRALAGVRVWFYRRFARGAALGMGFQRSGDLLSRLVRDIQALDNLYLRILVPFLSMLLTLPVVGFIWLRAGLLPGLLVTGIFMIMSFVLPALAARQARVLGPNILQAEAGLRVAALDLSSGLREARAFGAEEILTQRILAEQGMLIAAQKALHARATVAQGLTRLLSQLGVGILFCTLMGLVFHGTHPVLVVSALFVALTALENVSGLTRAGLLLGQVIHAAHRVVGTVSDEPAEEKGFVRMAEGDLVFENVRFRWQDEGPCVFDGVTLRLRRGEHVALVAPSGTGKSTLAALILRAVQPQSGRIRIGNTDLVALTEDALRRQIGWLSQSSHLFDDTVRGNLLLGRTDISDSALWTALEQAKIADVVRSLPEGLDAWIGENGSKVSGGQGRRIALARVLLSKAPFLILDEPTAGLDADTARAFMDTLNTVAEGRSMILITHHLTGAERLDGLWTIQDRRIVFQPR